MSYYVQRARWRNRIRNRARRAPYDSRRIVVGNIQVADPHLLVMGDTYTISWANGGSTHTWTWTGIHFVRRAAKRIWR